ncbi:MAG: nucleotidyltransferase domain-containing protein [Candidatus Hydrogenedentes bacterium]|nr:nucleotidyltransferase domain-containing protein [Candidatus Hydrogenedentota bacterium]
MNALIESHHEALTSLCRRYHVDRLETFGSATDETFDPERSDLDFLVVFKPCTPNEHYDRYFGLLEALEALFQRPVDLVEARAMKNPYFIHRVNESRALVYAA